MVARWIRVLAAAAITASATAHAQTVVPDARVAERLSCLVRSRPLPDFQAKHAFDGSTGLVRVKLSFTHRDYAPRVEVLHAVGDARMRTAVEDYLLGYRLPCMKDGDPVVEAVQEFQVGGPAGDDRLTQLPTARVEPACLRQPTRAPAYQPERGAAKIVHVIAQAAFVGAGDQPPKVTLVYNSGGPAAESAVREFLDATRMPCRTGSDAPFRFEYSFSLQSGPNVTHVVAPRELTLAGFLGLVKDKHLIKGRFDLNSMACPFTVTLALRRPALPNLVREVGTSDANRAVFLDWLSGLTPDYADKRQADELFNAELRVAVPCGSVEL